MDLIRYPMLEGSKYYCLVNFYSLLESEIGDHIIVPVNLKGQVSRPVKLSDLPKKAQKK